MIKKFNNGRLAILCENCYSIIFSGNNIPDDLDNNKKYFCSKECEIKYKEKL